MISTMNQWSEISPDPLTVEAIRERHTPQSHYRISPNRYASGTFFIGSSRAGRIYVLSGSCSKNVGAWSVTLGPGAFADFPAGDFTFQVLGDQEVQLVNVWSIPEPYRAKGDA